MGREIYDIINDMAEVLNASKMQKLQEVLVKRLSENTVSDYNPFDLIVEALTENTLSENAKACFDNRDTYFSEYNANLDAWEIKYCLDNDDSRFDWADTTNGKGVIYYMKDEWGNEAHYDFKNIQFVIKVNDKDEPFFTLSIFHPSPTYKLVSFLQL